jgi:hypothetical protein
VIFSLSARAVKSSRNLVPDILQFIAHGFFMSGIVTDNTISRQDDPIQCGNEQPCLVCHRVIHSHGKIRRRRLPGIYRLTNGDRVAKELGNGAQH